MFPHTYPAHWCKPREDIVPPIVLIRGDDTDAFNLRKISIIITGNIDTDGATASFELSGIKREWTREELATKTLTLAFTKDETSSLPIGMNFGRFQLTDSKSRVITLSRNIPFRVTTDSADAVTQELGADITINANVGEETNSTITIEFKSEGGVTVWEQKKDTSGVKYIEPIDTEVSRIKLASGASIQNGDVTLTLPTEAGQLARITDIPWNYHKSYVYIPNLPQTSGLGYQSYGDYKPQNNELLIVDGGTQVDGYYQGLNLLFDDTNLKDANTGSFHCRVYVTNGLAEITFNGDWNYTHYIGTGGYSWNYTKRAIIDVYVFPVVTGVDSWIFDNTEYILHIIPGEQISSASIVSEDSEYEEARKKALGLQ
jgi:hypothetical protein